MKTVSQLVQETIDFMDRGFSGQAFASASLAVAKTAEKAYQKSELSETDYKQFLKENWALISFMALPDASPMTTEFKTEISRILPTFNVHFDAQEIIVYAVSQTLLLKKLPGMISFNSQNIFEIKNKQLLLPPAIVFGLIGSVITHPANREETISDKYWFSISDFRTFVSEFWGRRDLAERIMKFYLER